MSVHNHQRDRHDDGRLLRDVYRAGGNCRFPTGTPKWWRKLFMTRPQRRKNARVCKQIMHGWDPDGLIAPLGNHKPHEYYW